MAKLILRLNGTELSEIALKQGDMSIGRRAGSVPGFDYSPAMKKSKLVWDGKTLDRFLANPMKVVPGTSMTYAGVPDAKDRADLIAYLRQAGESAACRK